MSTITNPVYTIHKTIFYLFLFFLTLGQLQRIEFGGGTLYVHDILICLFIGAYVLAKFASPHPRGGNEHKVDKNVSVPASGIQWEIVTKLLATQLLNTINSHKLETLLVTLLTCRTLLSAIQLSDLTPILYLARLATYGLFIYFLFQTFKSKMIQNLWFISACGLLYLGFLQYFLVPDSRFLAILGWDDHYYRLISTLFDPAFTGLVFVFAILWLLTKSSVSNKMHFIGLSLFTSGLVLTYSRSSFLALGVCILYCVLCRLSDYLVSKVSDTSDSQILFSKSYLAKDRHPELVSGSPQTQEDCGSVSAMTKNIGIIVLTSIIVLLFAPKPGGEGVNLLRTSTIEARVQNIQTNTYNITPDTLIFGKGLFINDQRQQAEGNRQLSVNNQQKAIGERQESNDKRQMTEMNSKKSGIPYHPRLPDNWPLILLNGGGLPALLIGFLIVSKVFLKNWKKDQLKTSLLLALLVHSLFSASILQPFVLLYFAGFYFGEKKRR